MNRLSDLSHGHIAIKYRPDIDGLRAIAVLSVVLFHAFPALAPGGFVGVDIFFVISGFLITSRLVKDARSGQFSYADFYARRIKRIFPALVAMLIAVIAAGWFTMTGPELQRLGTHILSSVLFFQNINLLKESGYFDLASDLKPLLHLWSLSIEEQFYIFWPIVIGVFGGASVRSERRLRASLWILVIASFILSLVRIERDQSSAFYEIQYRLWELGAGGLLAALTPRMQVALKKISPNALSGAGLVAIGLSFALITQSSKFPGAWALLPVLGSCAILIAGPQAVLNRRFLSLGPMVWIGLISYPLYLWHWPLLSFLRILSNETYLQSPTGQWLRAGAVLLSIALAYGTYVLIEKPIQRFAVTRSKLVIATLVVLFLLTGVFGRSAKFENGFRSRFAATIAEPPFPPEVERWKPLRACEGQNLPNTETCLTNAPESSTQGSNDKPDVVVIGDSHSLAIAPAIADYYTKKGRTTYEFQIGDTMGLLGTGNVYRGGVARNGIRSPDEIFRWAETSKARTVVLISRWPVYFEGHGVGVETRGHEVLDLENPRETNRAAIVTRALERTLAFLRVRKIETVLLYDFAELGFYPEDECLARPVSLVKVRRNPCAVSRSSVEQRQKGYRDAFAQVLKQFPDVKTHDLTEPLCGDDWCYGLRYGRLLYWDNNHINAMGAYVELQAFDF